MNKVAKRTAWIVGIVALLLVLSWFRGRPKELMVTTPQKRDVIELVVASGTVNSIRRTAVGAESAGTVATIEVDEGDRVTAGQLLGQLTAGETDARLAQTRAALRAADKNLTAEQATFSKIQQEIDRLRPLARAGQVSKAELDRQIADGEIQSARVAAARAGLQQARAEVNRVAPEFDRREVRAPFDGLITRRLVDPGTPVTAAQTWFEISELGESEIEVETDENNLGKLRVGQTVIAVSPAYPGTPLRGTVRQVGPFVDSERGVVLVKVTPESLPDFVLPNMTVDVSIEVRRSEGGLALPVSAVSLQARPPHVMAVASDGTVSLMPVTVEGRNPDWVAVAGIAASQQVLQEVSSARPGSEIRPVTAGDQTATAGRPGT
ncbi:MAG: efflux RND transporter periplasmic adaptor subunit [Chromatiales bacterium]|jgi:HlyD family secretion protein|nr:MAG: efflux RND transporter periplasmic adaptor subunit [Chromatiales bacterium]